MKRPSLFAATIVLVVAGGWVMVRACEGGRSASPGAAPAVVCGGAVPVEVVAAGVAAPCPRRPTKVVAPRAGGAVAPEACEACSAWAGCQRVLEGADATVQVVPLRNGVMCVYAADSPARAHVVQTALVRRLEHLSALNEAGDRVHLCPACRAMRGATASGTLGREVIKIEGGCITLTTSTAPAVVARIRAEAGLPGFARVKD